MADESNQELSRPARNSKRPRDPAAEIGDVSRGPRIPPLFLIFGFGFLVLILFAMMTDSAPEMSFTEFQKHWDDRKQSYFGFDSAYLSNETLLLKLSEPPAEPSEPAAKSASSATAKADGPVLEQKDSKKTDADPAKESIFKRQRFRKVQIPEKAIDSAFLARLATIKDFRYEPGNPLVTALLHSIIWATPLILILYFFVLRPLRQQAGPGNVLAFGRSRPRLIAKDHTGVKFSDVAGADEAKEEVTEVIEFLKNPDKFAALGGRIPRGMLFVGPPGTGKTLLAKAIAGEADVPFYSICGSDFVEMFVGVGASRVRDLFRQAKENTPCIIFLDEVDAVGRRRGSGLGGGHDEREQTLNAILVEMDGFDTNEQVIVIAATNRPDVLDPALLRPGRFDREVVISLPDLKGRQEILKVHARNVKLGEAVDLERIARGTPMFSGADLESLVNEAAIRATMAGKKFVEQDDLEEARDKVRFGRQKRSRVMDEQDRQVSAYHEAGHAMVIRLCPDVEPLHKVTIIPRGMSGGSTMWLPLKDRFTYTRRNFLGQIKVCFGGRIAESIFLQDISSGAVQDIEHATEIARRMVCDYGMSEDLGPIRYANKEQQVFLGGEMSHPREYSEATAERIDSAVRQIVNDCYRDAEQILKNAVEDTRLLALALLRHETLNAEEIDTILKTRDIESVQPVGAIAATA